MKDGYLFIVFGDLTPSSSRCSSFHPLRPHSVACKKIYCAIDYSRIHYYCQDSCMERQHSYVKDLNSFSSKLCSILGSVLVLDYTVSSLTSLRCGFVVLDRCQKFGTESVN